MAKNKNTDSAFLQFFNEESAEVINPKVEEGIPLVLKDETPFIGQVTAADETETNTWWRSLRKFFATSISEDSIKNKKKGLTPIVLSSLKESEKTPDHYPLWLNDPSVDDSGDGSQVGSFREILENCIQSFAPDSNEGTILKRNIPRFLEEINNKFKGSYKPKLARSVIQEALDKTVHELDIKGDEGKPFNADIEKLLNTLPQTGVLIPFSNVSTFYILAAALITEVSDNRKNLQSKIGDVIAHLDDLLSTEMENYPGEDNDHIKSSLGTAGSLVDTDQFSSVLPESASEHMPEKRIERIKNVITVLRNSGDILNTVATILIRDGLLGIEFKEWTNIFEDSEVLKVSKGSICSKSFELFSTKVKGYEKLVSALRTGQLEIENLYSEDIHNEYFDAFNWRMFNDTEMGSFPPILFLVDQSKLMNNELKEFHELLVSGYPVECVVIKSNSVQNKGTAGIDDIFFSKQEPATMAVSYRNTFVMQSTSLSPQYLFKGFYEGISSFTPALFYILADDDSQANSYLRSSSKVESRDFPGFIYNANQELEWGRRFDISDNPQSTVDWPVHTLPVRADNGQEEISLPFTFVDFAAMDDRYDREYMVVPSKYWTENLVLIADYINLSDKDKYGKIPFIWMVDSENKMHKVAVSWKLYMKCTERLDFWHYIQDSAGINNYHVNHALEEAKVKLQQELESEIEKLNVVHEAEIERVKKDTAGEAMERLTSALLDLDTDTILRGPSVGAPSTSKVDEPVEQDKSVAEEGAQGEVEEEEEMVSDEPWIETPLCTSCNECTDINNRLFNYNGDKMAFIADSKAGTFAELVDAAEKCPVKIIHPGKPLNTDEPGLDALIKIAEKFN